MRLTPVLFSLPGPQPQELSASLYLFPSPNGSVYCHLLTSARKALAIASVPPSPSGDCCGMMVTSIPLATQCTYEELLGSQKEEIHSLIRPIRS